MRLSTLVAVVSLIATTGCESRAAKETSPNSGESDAGEADAGPSDAGESDAGPGDAGSPDGGIPLGQPITAAPGQWTWVPFSDAQCANGNPVGIGVNLSTTSSRVLIYLEGGGACWSALTCYTLQTASYFTSGYGESDFTTESQDTSYLAEAGGFFDRTAAANPFKDYSYVYVPYCTGDLHAGDNVVQYGTNTAMHVGFRNMSAYLARLVPTFPSADRVYLTGSSAGGLGAGFNWWQTQQAFGSIRVDLIDDSGTAMPPDVEAEGANLEPTLRTQWNLAATLPPGCTGCATRLDALYGFYEQTFPNQRAALLSYTQDTVLPNFYGITETQFMMGLNEEITDNFTSPSNFKYFLVSASGHVLWFTPSLMTNGVTLQTYLTQMVTDDSAWTNEHP
jgi:hypothetical protein